MIEHRALIGRTERGRPVWPIAGGSGEGDPGGGQGEPAGQPSGGGQAQGGTDPAGGQPAGGQPSGGGQTGGGQPQPQGGGQPPSASDRGFPEGVPLEQMTTEQQTAYWRYYARQHEQRNKDLLALADGDPDKLKEKVQGYDQLRQQQQTEQERAVEAAKAEGRQEAMDSIGPRLVAAEMRAQAAGRIGDEQLATLTSSLDANQFLDSNGDVDTDKVKSLIDGLAPAQTPEPGKGDGAGTHPDLGQGRRQGQPSQGGIDAGREKARQRHPQLQQQQ